VAQSPYGKLPGLDPAQHKCPETTEPEALETAFTRGRRRPHGNPVHHHRGEHAQNGVSGASHAVIDPDLAMAALFPARPAPTVAAGTAGSIASTAFEKLCPGAVLLSVPSTNATTSSCSSLRPARAFASRVLAQLQFGCHALNRLLFAIEQDQRLAVSIGNPFQCSPQDRFLFPADCL